MTLEFRKIAEQVNNMGQYLAEQENDREDKADIAWEIMLAHEGDEFIPYVDERVQDAIDKDAGYRGARPLDEALTDVFPAAELPPAATLLATDGSQIPVKRHGAAQYYLLNIGTIVVHHGSGAPPIIKSEPYLFYERGYLVDADYNEIKSSVIQARRTVAEMAALAENAWEQRGEARPLIALMDGNLLMVINAEVPDRNQLFNLYYDAMTRMEEVNAALTGYIDRPRSKFVTRLLRLLDMPAEEVSRKTVGGEGRLEGLRDTYIFQRVLEPGERTAIFVQMSPQNKEFRKQGGDSHEIAFFYMNVASHYERPRVVRVEIPMWVVHDRETIAEIQALLYLQCQQLASSRYPYVLTRADELAVIGRDESRQLDMMIQVAMNRHGITAASSDKEAGKRIARSPKKTRFTIG